MDVAIVHEWLTNRAGSEACVAAMRLAFPSHRLYTSLIDPVNFEDWSCRTSALQRLPLLRRSHTLAMPLIVPAMRRLRISTSHDVVIRSLHSFASLPEAPLGTPEVIYCHTPPRFAYEPQALSGERAPIRLGMRLLGSAIRATDQRRVRGAQRVLANSRHIARRIRDVYGIDADVVHPPVHVDRFGNLVDREPGDYFIYCGRLVPYKRPDVAIEAFRGISERLVVAGDGRMRRSLERDAPPNVAFVGHVSDGQLAELVGRSRGFVFPAKEDFGIAPVEALAAGVPVVALGAGGSLDYVKHGENGVLVAEQTAPAFARAVKTVTSISWDRHAISASVGHFNVARFVSEMRGVVTQVVTDAAH